MERKVPELLVAAKELRHPELFNNCLHLCLGPWHSPSMSRLQDPQLKKIVDSARQQLCPLLVDVQGHIIRAVGSCKARNYDDGCSKIVGRGVLDAAGYEASKHKWRAKFWFRGLSTMLPSRAIQWHTTPGKPLPRNLVGLYQTIVGGQFYDWKRFTVSQLLFPVSQI